MKRNFETFISVFYNEIFSSKSEFSHFYNSDGSVLHIVPDCNHGMIAGIYIDILVELCRKFGFHFYIDTELYGKIVFVVYKAKNL